MVLLLVYEGIVEFRPAASAEQWAPATVKTTIVSADATSTRLQVTVLDADGSTALFDTPVQDPLMMQCDTSKLDSDRCIAIFDESNDNGVDLRFSDRHEAKTFMIALVSGAFRANGCVLPQVLAINADQVRRNKAVEAPATQAYSLQLDFLRSALFDPWTFDYQQDIVTDHNYVGLPEAKACASIGGPEVTSTTDVMQALLLQAREGLQGVIAVGAPQLRSMQPQWLPDAIRELVPDSDAICTFLFTVVSIDASDDAKRESIKRRLQRQGAHTAVSTTTPTLKPVALRKVGASNDSFSAVLPPPVSEADVGRQASPETPGSTKGSSKKKKSEEEKDATAALVVDTALPSEVLTKRSKTKKSRTEVEEDRTEHIIREGSPASPSDFMAANADSSAADCQQLIEFQLKLERKKQRLLKLEAEVLQSMEAAQHIKNLNEMKAAEVSALRAGLDADRAQFSQQQDAFRIQQFTFYQQQQEDAKGANSATRRNKAIASPQGKGGEREPLLASVAPMTYQHIQGPDATYSLRVEHPFYDNSTLPPAVVRCYPVASAFISAFHHVAGCVALWMLLGGGIGIVGWNLADRGSTLSVSEFWPLVALFASAIVLHGLTLRHKGSLYDGLHRLDQSCSQFDPVAYIYQRTNLFVALPVAIVAVSLASLVVLLATSLPMWLRVGILLGTCGTTLSFGAFSLFLMLVATIAWDRVCAVVPAAPGTLCSKLSIRRVSAQYQFVKALVAGVSREWSIEILSVLVILLTVMLYCLYAAIETDSYTGVLVYNGLFAWGACFSFAVLRAVCGWQVATLAAVGTVTQHSDRWARGDYNAEGDLRMEDYVTLQSSLVHATVGSAYTKWVLHPMENLGRVWMWSCGFLALASLVMFPISVLYHFSSWDAAQ